MLKTSKAGQIAFFIFVDLIEQRKQPGSLRGAFPFPFHFTGKRLQVGVTAQSGGRVSQNVAAAHNRQPQHYGIVIVPQCQHRRCRKAISSHNCIQESGVVIKQHSIAAGENPATALLLQVFLVRCSAAEITPFAVVSALAPVHFTLGKTT